jgi:hypothetical protein
MTEAVIVAIVGVAVSVVGSGFATKLMTSAIRENLRELFVTKDEAASMFMLREIARQEFVPREIFDTEMRAMNDRMTDHIIEPLKEITRKLESVMYAQAKLFSKVFPDNNSN